MYSQTILFSDLLIDVQSEILTKTPDKKLWLLARTSHGMLALVYLTLLRRYADKKDARKSRQVLNSLCNQLDLVFIQSASANALREYLRQFVKLSYNDPIIQISHAIPNRLLALFALRYCSNELDAEFFSTLQLVKLNNPILFYSMQGRYASLCNDEDLYLVCSNHHRQALNEDVRHPRISLVDHLFAIHTFPENYSNFFGEALTQPESFARSRGIVKEHAAAYQRQTIISIRTALEAALKCGLLEEANIEEIREHCWALFVETTNNELLTLVRAASNQLKQPRKFLNQALRVLEEKHDQLADLHMCGTLFTTSLRAIPKTEAVSWMATELYSVALSARGYSPYILNHILLSFKVSQFLRFFQKINIVSELPPMVVQAMELGETTELVDLPTQKKLILLLTLLNYPFKLRKHLSGSLATATGKIIATIPPDDLFSVLKDTIFPLCKESINTFGFIEFVLQKLYKQADLLWCFDELVLLFKTVNGILKLKCIDGIALVLQKLPLMDPALLEKLVPLEETLPVASRDEQAMKIIPLLISKLPSEQQVLDILYVDVFPGFKKRPVPAIVFANLDQAWKKLSASVILNLLHTEIYPLLQDPQSATSHVIKTIGSALLVLPPEQTAAELKEKLLPLCEKDSFAIPGSYSYWVGGSIRELVQQRPNILDGDLQTKMVQGFCQNENNGVCAEFLAILIASSATFSPEEIQLLFSQSHLLAANDCIFSYDLCDLFVKLYQQLFANNTNLIPNLVIPQNTHPDTVVYFFDRLLSIPDLPEASRAFFLTQIQQFNKIYSAMRAVAQGNFAELTPMLALGIDVNEALDEHGNRLLHSICARAGEQSFAMLEDLYEYYPHIDVEVRNHFGEAPLHCAAAAGNTGAITSLCERGANLNAVTTDSEKRTAFKVAWDSGQKETAIYLMDLLAPKSSRFRFLSSNKQSSTVPEEALEQVDESQAMDLDSDDYDNSFDECYERPTKRARFF